MGERFRIFITEPKDHPAIRSLELVGDVRRGAPDRRLGAEELAGELEDSHAALITSRDSITRSIIERARALRVIGKFGARPENVDWEAATARGVRVVWSPEANSDSVAEYAVLLILAHFRRLVDAVAHLRRGEWRNTFPAGRELKGKIVGLVGLGNVGLRVARCLGGFGVRLLGHDPWVPRDRFIELGVEPVSLGNLLEQSDVVSLHAMVTAQTRGMIDGAALRRMKRHALLVNTARGALVDEKTLARAIAEEWIQGACLDVFSDEPVGRDHPLVTLPRTLVSPHIAAQTVEAQDREIAQTVEDVIRVLQGAEPVHSPPF